MLDQNDGRAPYVGITRDTCQINVSKIIGKKIILGDDVYTEGKNIAEDCAQALFDLGAKDVILYAVAKTKDNK